MATLTPEQLQINLLDLTILKLKGELRVAELCKQREVLRLVDGVLGSCFNREINILSQEIKEQRERVIILRDKEHELYYSPLQP